jgi:flagellar hook-length control protein FliK
VPAPSLSVSLPVVEEQLLPADQAEQVTARSPAAKPMDSSTSRSGGFALPIADLLSADDTDLSIVKTWLEKTGEASSASKAPVSAEDGEIVRVSGKKGQAASNPGLQATRNTGSFVKLAFAPLLRSSRQSQTDSPAVEHPRRENAGQLSTGRESVQEDRTVRVSPSFAGSIVSLDQKAEGKDREVVTAEPMPVKAVGVEEKTPVQSKAGETPVASEEMPAKAVVTAKPVMESASRETDASKNSLPHLQTQVTPVRSSVTRLDPGTTRFTEVPMPMSTETARSVVDQVVKEAALQVRGEASEMRITLVPASLGEVKLSVRMEGGQMQAQIDVSHAAVKAALEVNLGQLRDALSSHGIEVQRLDVYHNGQSLAGDTRGNQGDRPRRQGGRHHSYATEAVDQLVTGRMMGYNTMEVVM